VTLLQRLLLKAARLVMQSSAPQAEEKIEEEDENGEDEQPEPAQTAPCENCGGCSALRHRLFLTSLYRSESHRLLVFPKRRLSAYCLFSAVHSQQVIKEQTTIASGDLIRRILAAWKAAPAAVKEQYKRRMHEDRGDMRRS
jgi:hypothetical protein